jgi:hypothetical protein
VSPLRPSDHPVLPSSLLFLFHSSSVTRKHTAGSSDGLCKLSFLHAVYQVHRRLHQWYRRFIRQCQFPSFSSAVLTLNYLLILTCDIFTSLGPINVYKDMLNNMVSLIDHVVMNHQNQTRTNGIWGHARYIYFLVLSFSILILLVVVHIFNYSHLHIKLKFVCLLYLLLFKTPFFVILFKILHNMY